MTQKQFKRNQIMLKHLLVYGALTVAALHVIGVVSGIPRIDWLFNLDNEFNLPAYYSGGLLAACGVLALFLAAKDTPKNVNMTWASIGAVFLYISFDEMAAIHERTAEPIRNTLAISGTNLLFHAWIIPVLVMVGLLLLYLYIASIRRTIARPHKTILIYIVALALGTIFFEILGTRFYFNPFEYKLGPVLAEEMFEIAMTSVILYKLFSYVKLETKPVPSRV